MNEQLPCELGEAIEILAAFVVDTVHVATAPLVKQRAFIGTHYTVHCFSLVEAIGSHRSGTRGHELFCNTKDSLHTNTI